MGWVVYALSNSLYLYKEMEVFGWVKIRNL